jgi:H+-translocating NAD(P) transhydrogenase subunit alpha
MRAAIPYEIAPNEGRVALIPETVTRLVKSGFEIAVQSGAGERAGHSDEAYRTAGATIAPDARALYATADIVLKVREPMLNEKLGVDEVDLLRSGATLIGLLGASRNPDLVRRLAERGVTAFAMDQIPRTTRAQRMDALSAMSTVAGYKAALLGATTLGKFFPLLMTAAGTIAPARVFILGAGVAGLQAIATSRRLGAVVEAFDVRPAVREEVQSLGATFVALDLGASLEGSGGYASAMTSDQERRERELIGDHVSASDVVIATAMVPGRKAPVLITADMVKRMRPGSVIVDLAAEVGGNCELTKPGGETHEHGVTILGPVNLAASLPVHASQMYSRTIAALLTHLVKEGSLQLDFDDEITRGTCLTHGGKVVAGASPPAPPPPGMPTPAPVPA